MKAEENVGIAQRSPEALLDFWLGPLRTAADASRENWQQGMRRWRLGPFARRTEEGWVDGCSPTISSGKVCPASATAS